jgi:hypothetical protein
LDKLNGFGGRRIGISQVSYVAPANIKFDVSTGRFSGKRDRQNQLFRTTAMTDFSSFATHSESLTEVLLNALATCQTKKLIK